jgi:hypothetical protein
MFSQAPIYIPNENINCVEALYCATTSARIGVHVYVQNKDSKKKFLSEFEISKIFSDQQCQNISLFSTLSVHYFKRPFLTTK